MNVHTIRFRLIALGVSLVLASAVLRLLIALPPVKDLLRDLVADQQLSIASYVARDIERSIEQRRTAIQLMAHSFPRELLDQPGALSDWLLERQRLLASFRGGLYAIDTEGTSLLGGSSSVSESEPIDFRGEEWFLAALNTHAPIVSGPQRGFAAGEPIIAFAMPVRDDEGHSVAVLAGFVRLDASGFLQGLLRHSRDTGGGLLLISPADKVFVSASDPSLILKPTPGPGVNLLHDRAMEGYRGTGTTINAAGIEELAAIASIPGTGWFVVARLPVKEAFAPIQLLQSMILNSTVVALVVVLGALLLLLSRILTPLTNTARAIRDMADGKRELGQLAITRNDEVGELVQGFNRLVGRLREKEEALKDTEARLSFMAHHDALTGLLNRGILDDRLQQAVERAARNGTSFAVLFFDLDQFKPINDRWGHEVGDAVLVQVAKRLAQGRRRTDTVARFGGDEFIVLLIDLDDAHRNAGKIAEEYLARMRQPYHVGEHTLALTVSIGIAVYQGGPLTAGHLLSQADMAMYRAKRGGSNAYRFYDAPDSVQS